MGPRKVVGASEKTIASAALIQKAEFKDVLSRYPDLIDIISAGKGVTSSKKTLKDLDHFRYVEAPRIFAVSDGDEKSKRKMELDDVKELIEWKLRHGKFRPTLMKLVSSNDEAHTKKVIKKAIDSYRKSPNIQAALDTLCTLKGIGPASASLLLTVHDPDQVIFFSDEAFYWLCCDRKSDTKIKYNKKECQDLQEQAEALCFRLGVSATDVEKVAYVLMKQLAGFHLGPVPELSDEMLELGAKLVDSPENRARRKQKAGAKAKDVDESAPVKSAPKKRKAEVKPKDVDESPQTDRPLRRSKRLKA